MKMRMAAVLHNKARKGVATHLVRVAFFLAFGRCSTLARSGKASMSSDALMCRDGRLAYIVIVQDWFLTNVSPRSRDGCCHGADYITSTFSSIQGADRVGQPLTGVPKGQLSNGSFEPL